MNKILLVALVFFCITQFVKGQDVEDWVVNLHEAHIYNELPYRIQKPINFNPDNKYPVIVSLHGGAGRGTDNRIQFRKWNQVLAMEENRSDYPCYVLVPQANEFWNELHLSNIKAVIKDLPSVDMNRIYILGHSMGGRGTYVFTQIDPGYFAAAAASAGSGRPEETEFIDVSIIKDIPFWIFHGDQDKTCPIEKNQKVFEEMQKVGGNMKFTTWEGDGHGVSVKLVAGGDNGSTRLSSNRCDPEPLFLKWLFKQKLSDRK
ncbi:MAG: dienelactone hydrolase family protein [Bacteroidetes bacterium]|nr:dienelactone hydrolase family protein [Bacteroidota bacterium]